MLPTMINAVDELVSSRDNALKKLFELNKLQEEFSTVIEGVGGSTPYKFDYRYDFWENIKQKNFEIAAKKAIDKVYWRRVVNYFNLQHYMLCSAYDELEDKIERKEMPEITIKNVTDWINGLKSLIYNNIETLIKEVFQKLTKSTYYVGSGYRAIEKKRNNNGVDATFILSTPDYNKIYNYYSCSTVTEDIEKVFYILSGNPVPEIPCIEKMKREKISYFENKFFSIRVCKNGNTHYKILDKELLNKINLCGASKYVIGENIKIKIFE